jgi:magnesium transporter
MIRCLFRSSEDDTFGDLPPDKLADALAHKDGMVWLDVAPEAGDHAEISRLLRERFAFHPLALDDAFEETHVPRVDDWGEYLYIVLHAAELAADNGLVLLEIDIFLGRNYLVSIHESPAAPLEQLWSRCRQQPFRIDPGRLLYALTDAVADDYMHVVEGLDDEIDRVEVAVFHRPRGHLVRRIFRTRRTLSQLRRVLSSLREVMNRLARDEFAVLAADERVYFRDVYDHLVRLYDIVEGLRDMAAGALDSYLSVTSNRINEVMRTLTVVNVLFMPLSFLAGFFGMNFFGEAFNVANPFSSVVLFWLCIVLMLVTPPTLLLWMARWGMLRPVGSVEPDEKNVGPTFERANADALQGSRATINPASAPRR